MVGWAIQVLPLQKEGGGGAEKSCSHAEGRGTQSFPAFKRGGMTSFTLSYSQRARGGIIDGP